MKNNYKVIFSILFIFSLIFCNPKKSFTIFYILKTNKQVDTLAAMHETSIKKINWRSQTYYFKPESLNILKEYPYGNPSFQLIFTYDNKEIYRASAFSKTSSIMPDPDVAIFFPEYYIGSPHCDSIKIFRVSSKITSSKLYNCAEKYLKETGLLMN